MNDIVKSCIFSLAFSVLCGCSAVQYYASDKASIGVDIRPDPTQPISGNLGLKRRVVLIVPPMDDKEAASVISSFHFGLDKGNVMEIDSAFITGKASTGLDDTQRQDAVKALGAPQIPTTNDIATKSIVKAAEQGKLNDLCVLVMKKSFNTLENDEMKKLESITKVGKGNYDMELHDQILIQLNKEGECTT
ncbi:MAG: hypothetical protein ACKVN9_09370 [Methylophilaceae bacterium]